MAYAEKLVKSWRACWKNAAGKVEKESGFSTKKAALDHAKEQEVDAQRHGSTRKDASRLLVSQWIDEWWTSLDLEPKTIRNYQVMLENHIIPTWGEHALRDLSQAGTEVAAWRKQLLEAGYARDTVNNISGLLRTICADAVDEGLMHRNPAATKRQRGKVGPRRQEQVEKKATKAITNSPGAFLIAERAAVLTGRPDEFILMIAMYFQGLRISEVMGLEKRSLSNTVALQYQLQPVGSKHAYRRKAPKDWSKRTLDLPPFLKTLLTYQARHVKHPAVMGGARWCPCGENLLEEYRHPPGIHLFTGVEGGYHWEQGKFRTQVYYPAAQGLFHPRDKDHRRPVYQSRRPDGSLPGPLDWDSERKGEARREAAVSCWAPIAPGITPHGMRHAHKSLLEQLGVAKPLMDERLGHSDNSVSGRYGHPTPVMREHMLKALQGEWEAAVEWRRAMGDESPVPLVNQILESGVESLDLHSRSTPDLKPRRRAKVRGRVTQGLAVLGFSLISEEDIRLPEAA